MWRAMLCAIALVLSAPALTQSVPSYPPPNTAALAALAAAAQAKADAAQARADAAIAAIPQRATTLPPAERTTPVLGTSMQFRGADDPQPRITRTASCSIVVSNGIGSCETLWDGSAFPAGTTVRLAGAPAIVTASVGTATEQPMTCKVYNLSVTGLGFRCWQAQSSALTLAALTAAQLTVLPFTAPAPSITVMVTALPTS